MNEKVNEKEKEVVKIPREYIPKAPFPQRLIRNKKEAQAAEMLEVLNKLK